MRCDEANSANESEIFIDLLPFFLMTLQFSETMRVTGDRQGCER